MDLIVPGFGLLIWQLSGLVYLGFWVYAILDCLKNDFQGPNQKLIWLILFAPIVGIFLYLGMSRRKKEKTSFQPDFNKKSFN